MNRAISLSTFVLSIVLAAAALAQQAQPAQQQRPAAAQPAAQPPGDAPPPRQLSPNDQEAQRRREEGSVGLDVLLARMSESTGMKFLVDPRVRMQVYGVPRIETPTYAELLTILRMHGFAAAEIEGRVNIVPDANARFLPVRLLQRDDDSVPDDEYVTRIITVPNAVQMVAIVRPLMPQSAHLASFLDAEGGDVSVPHKLLIMDTYANVRRITEIVNTLTR